MNTFEYFGYCIVLYFYSQKSLQCRISACNKVFSQETIEENCYFDELSLVKNRRSTCSKQQ